ncbi:MULTISPECIES: hypothetical protein [unclassified Bradyrhizobium]|uniref:hypothetical protein n=1 Tax=unclassified Bradyrhizobium TaxID=2631580 RepID=UPI001CD671C0|nr:MULTISPECIES: hypothetical protein [unclassified Bradyrhizobium]MCA1393664.1 hypothetical protein [Bradyrhizobium sp. IC3123]MCA1429166.1 hypothetical protein [Bradyrhizobium sp. NBAIM16]MCA1479984.1 hypothetical protein [Bradyrhizobium sp. NBAIM08]MCA1500288.1 hypothetical protein [Bradyrhizobium sp. NBAIM14]MCA1507798.1 hypothetical protein [Bradyrhizobium sp. NBAIM02]
MGKDAEARQCAPSATKLPPSRRPYEIKHAERVILHRFSDEFDAVLQQEWRLLPQW